MSLVTLLLPTDDVNIDDSIVPFTDDGVTSMTTNELILNV